MPKKLSKTQQELLDSMRHPTKPERVWYRPKERYLWPEHYRRSGNPTTPFGKVCSGVVKALIAKGHVTTVQDPDAPKGYGKIVAAPFIAETV